MKKYFNLVYILWGVLFLLSSCRSARVLTENKEVEIYVMPSHNPMSILRDSIKVNDVMNTSFSAAFTVNVESDGFNQNLSGQIRMIYDSILWVSIGKFGIEGMRLYVTKNEAVLINKLERTYSKMDFSTITKLMGVEVSLAQLQELMLGTQISLTEDISFSKEEETWLLTSKFKHIPDYFTTLIVNATTYQIEKIRLFSSEDNFVNFTYYYDDKRFKKGVYKSLEVYAFLGVAYNIVLNFNRVNYNPIGNLNLNIPSNYKPQQIF